MSQLKKIDYHSLTDESTKSSSATKEHQDIQKGDTLFGFKLMKSNWDFMDKKIK